MIMQDGRHYPNLIIRPSISGDTERICHARKARLQLLIRRFMHSPSHYQTQELVMLERSQVLCVAHAMIGRLSGHGCVAKDHCKAELGRLCKSGFELLKYHRRRKALTRHSGLRRI